MVLRFLIVRNLDFFVLGAVEVFLGIGRLFLSRRFIEPRLAFCRFLLSRRITLCLISDSRLIQLEDACLQLIWYAPVACLLLRVVCEPSSVFGEHENPRLAAGDESFRPRLVHRLRPGSRLAASSPTPGEATSRILMRMRLRIILRHKGVRNGRVGEVCLRDRLMLLVAAHRVGHSRRGAAPGRVYVDSLVSAL